MKFPRMVLAAVAVALAATATSNVQANLPGMPITNAPAAEQINGNDDRCERDDDPERRAADRVWELGSDARLRCVQDRTTS